MRSAESKSLDTAARLAPRIQELAVCRSTPELLAHPLYREIQPQIREVLETPQTGSFARGAASCKRRYRVLAWNIERGTQFEGQLTALREHPYLSTCDVLLLTETDLGMARSGNRDVAQGLARELGMHYAFAPCYWSLVKGSGVERYVDGENEIGLHGNAVLSRYPIARARPVPLKNGVDKMATREQRIGRQTALEVDIAFPDFTAAMTCVHLDANSSQGHRARQMRDVVTALNGLPAVIGGDWNTTTFNSSTAFRAILGYWQRVFMGADNVIRNHYLHPYRRFERELFETLERAGFDYRSSNAQGEHTIYYSFDNERTFQGLAEWVPLWCFPFMRWALRSHGGGCPLKLDWFATRGLPCENPAVVHDVREGRAAPLSDHDAIGIDIGSPS